MPPSYAIADPEALLSPSLVIFRDLVRANLAAMIRLVGDPARLRPHAKTHKMPALIRLELDFGITKHKCATIAEAEMIARAGGRDILIAYPMVGPNIARVVDLMQRHPEATFRVLVDHFDAAAKLSARVASQTDRRLPVLLDLDLGMGRTGVTPDAAEAVFRQIAPLTGLLLDGLHGYDGHVRDADPDERFASARPGVEATLALRDRLRGSGFVVDRVVFGGTVTLPIHAVHADPHIECSPGTSVLHDADYHGKFPDLPFTPAALLLTRVVSRPARNRICLDLGHKAVAADPPGHRLRLVHLPDAVLGSQSEEHLIVETHAAADLPPGTPLLAIPTHICPTCALHRRAYVVEDGQLVDEWEVEARDRVLSV